MSRLLVKKSVFCKGAVQRSFDQASGNYNQFTAMQREIGDRLLSAQKEKRPVQKGLDVGAGTGYLTRKLKEHAMVDQLYAVDISTGMLRQTIQNMGGLTLSGAVCADAEKLPINDGSMKVVYSNLAYQWCSNLEQAFDEVYRVLDEDGTFVFSTFGPDTLSELKNTWALVDDAVHVNSFVTTSEIKQYLESVGFKNISIQSENMVTYYETPKALMLGLKGMGAHNVNEGRPSGLTGVRAFKLMLEKYEALGTEKGIPATFEAIYVAAEKQ